MSLHDYGGGKGVLKGNWDYGNSGISINFNVTRLVLQLDIAVLVGNLEGVWSLGLTKRSERLRMGYVSRMIKNASGHNEVSG